MSKKYEIYWARIAERDLQGIIEYINLESPSTAKTQLELIRTKASKLNLLPLRGRIVPELQQQGIFQYRELVVPPWRIIYRISERDVYVLSVIDSRQNVEDILLNRLLR